MNKGKGDWGEKGHRKLLGRAVEGKGGSAGLGVLATLGRKLRGKIRGCEGSAGAADPGLICREESTGGVALRSATAPPPSFKKNRSIVSAGIVTHCL